MMHLISLHVNRAKRSGRAEVFAGTASDAFAVVDVRHLNGSVWTFIVNHLNGACGAVTCAVAATDAIGQHHTVFLDPNGMANMDGGFCLT